MRREHGGCVLCRKIATFFIAFQGAIDEIIEFLLRAALAGSPDVAEVFRPVWFSGQELPIGELLRFQPCLRRFQALRRVRRRMRLLAALQRPPEGRIDPVGTAGFRLQPGWLVQQVPGKAANGQVIVAQLLLQRLVCRNACRIVTAVPEHCVSAGFGYQLAQRLAGVAACKNKATAGFSSAAERQAREW